MDKNIQKAVLRGVLITIIYSIALVGLSYIDDINEPTVAPNISRLITAPPLVILSIPIVIIHNLILVNLFPGIRSVDYEQMVMINIFVIGVIVVGVSVLITILRNRKKK